MKFGKKYFNNFCNSIHDHKQHKDTVEWLVVGNKGKDWKEVIILYANIFLPYLPSGITWVA